MKRFARMVLVVLFLGALAPFTAGQAVARQDDDTPAKLRLDIQQMNPRWITSTSTTLNISGSLTNTGDRRITDVKARLQLGERQTSDRQLRASMAEAPPTDSSLSKFLDVTRAIEPGQTVPLNLTVRLDSPAGLQFTRPGVYPLLVNVNGSPEYGGQARLASLSTLLPVLSVPGEPAPPKPDKPTPVSVLWPISDTKPRVVAAPLGAPLVLSDDDLATDLNAGGRLDSLVSAAQTAEADPRASGALCFAVDPDLLDTVDAMTRGYQVRTPGGLAQGRGADAAKRWMAALTRVVKGRCVVQMPYADASLSTLNKVRGAEQDLTAAAVGTGQRVRDLLGVEPLPGVLWTNGAMDGTTLGRLPDAGVRTLLTDPAHLQASSSVTSMTGIAGTTLRAQPSDSLLATSLGGGVTKPASAPGTILPSDDPDVAVQNGLAVLAFRGGLGPSTAAKPLLVTPPRHWTAPAAELGRLMDAVSEFGRLGMVAPQPLQDLLDTPASGRATMSYGAQDVTSEPPAEITDELARQRNAAGDLRGALSVDPATQVDPNLLVKPLRDGVIRATSSVFRGDTASIQVATANAGAQLNDMLGAVNVTPPGQVISLASGSSPLPVAVSNNLPVAVTARITLANNTGLRSGPVPDQTIPARGALNVLVPTEALRSGQFTVDVALSTPGGTQLGPSATFELRSNEYGTVTVIVTASAAGALVLLSGRRIFRRIRARRTA